MIKIKKSPTADSRTCDWSKVSEKQLLDSSKQHIQDVCMAMDLFQKLIKIAKMNHDHDKVSEIKWFHHDFMTGFEEQTWYKNHKRVNRHHITDEDGCPEDVNLIDVLEYIADCTMAGLARSGKVREITLDEKTLMKAFVNTCKLLEQNVEVED